MSVLRVFSKLFRRLIIYKTLFLLSPFPLKLAGSHPPLASIHQFISGYKGVSCKLFRDG